MVREFYSNMFDTAIGYEVRVRGRPVTFTTEAINALFHLPDIPVDNDELAREDDNNYSIQEVTEVITTPGAQWVMKRNGQYKHLLISSLTHEARVWFYFVNSRLIPSSHVSDCTLDRALLIYSILTGRQINLGRLICHLMRMTSQHIQWGLWFMDIVTRLCTAAGALPAMGDLYFRPGIIISGVPPPVVDPLPEPTPAPAPAPVSDLLGQAIQDLQHQLLSQHEELHRGLRLHTIHVDQWFRHLALSVPGCDPSSFPQLPAFFGDPDEDEPAPAPAPPGDPTE